MPNDESKELLPCPFCGGEAGIAQTDKGVELGLPKEIFVLACKNCETGWSNVNLDVLITKWNTRTRSSPEDARAKAERIADDLFGNATRLILENSP